MIRSLQTCLAVVLAIPVGAAFGVDDVTEVFQVESTRRSSGPSEGDTVHYRLMRPATVEPGVVYPLVIFLHGSGERGSDNRSQLHALPRRLGQDHVRQQYPCFALAVQCPLEQQWADTDWDNKGVVDFSRQPTEAMQGTIDAMTKVLAEEPIDQERIYLTGLSMGGYGSFDLAMRMPQTFGAVAPICGGGDPDHAWKLVGTPMWIFHGARDTVVIPDRSREMNKAMKDAGGTPKYTEFSHLQHNSWDAAYDHPEFMEWMFSQRRNSDGWKPLFPDDSMAGWKRIGGNANYELADGQLHGWGSTGRNAFLTSDRTYGDFILECDVKINDRGNSGIQVRSQPHENHVSGYQIEIDPSPRAWSGGLYDENRTGWIQPPPEGAAREAFDPAAWNHYRIECIGPRLRTWVNGIQCVDYDQARDRSGVIALQVHSGNCDVRWKNLRIREFQADPVDAAPQKK